MKLKRQRKILLLILGVGACALIADQFTGRGQDKTEPAGTTPVAAANSAPRAAAMPAMVPAKPPAQTETLLSKRIRAAATQSLSNSNPRDVFCIMPEWSGVKPSTVGPSSATANAGSPEFGQVHRLTGVIVAGARSSAIIDGKLVMVGQSVDGYRLISVTKNQAKFEKGDGLAVLRLEELE